MRTAIIVLALTCCCTLALAQPYCIKTFDDLEAITARKGFSPGPAEAKIIAADTAAVGEGAVTVTLPPRAKVTVPLQTEVFSDVEALDQCNGIRLWLKGDGSDGYGCVAFGSDGAFIYELWFPLKDT